MELNDYPKAIYDHQLKLNGSRNQVEIQQERLAFLDGEIESAIALNPDLKNEQQRKAERLKLRQEPDYLQAQSALKAAKETLKVEEIYLTLLRNQFGVAKLFARRQIVELELNRDLGEFPVLELSDLEA